MSTDIFYFCSNLELVSKWWGQPVSKTIDDLLLLHLDDENSHWGLIDNKTLKEVLIPCINFFNTNNENKVSLRQICQSTVDNLLSKKEEPIFFFKKSGDPKQNMVMLGDVFNGLLQSARQGPTNIKPMDIRVVNEYFAKRLANFINVDEVEKNYRHYSPKDHNLHDLGPVLPPELNEDLLKRFNININNPVKMNHATWLYQWERLERFPNFWASLLTDSELCSLVKGLPNLKMPESHMPILLESIKKYALSLGIKDINLIDRLAKTGKGVYLGKMPIYTNEDVVVYLRQMVNICQYAQNFNFAMLAVVV